MVWTIRNRPRTQRSASLHLLIVPLQPVQLTLIGPIFNLRHQPMPHRVLTDIGPLVFVAVAPPQLSLPETFLPHGLLGRARPSTRGMRFPKTYPLFKSDRLDAGGRTKQMKMIRHHDVSANRPRIRCSPTRQQQLLHILASENGFTFISTDCEIDDRRTIMGRDGREMDGRLTLRKLLAHVNHREGRAPPPPFRFFATGGHDGAWPTKVDVAEVACPYQSPGGTRSVASVPFLRG